MSFAFSTDKGDPPDTLARRNLGSTFSIVVGGFPNEFVTSGDCDTPGCPTAFGNNALLSTGDEPIGALTMPAFIGFGRCLGVMLVV